MKKEVKGIIALSAVLAVLGGGLAVMKLTEKPEENNSSVVEETTQPEGAGIILVEDSTSPPRPTAADEITNGFAESYVKTVRVVNQTDELNVILKNAPADSTPATYTLRGYEELDVDTSLVGTLANNADGLVSASLIEEDSKELGKYGLEQPSVTVELEYGSGNVRKFYIGDTAPIKSQTYLRVEGSNDVYTVATSAIANYSKTPKEFINKTILAEPSEDEYPVINSLRIERDDIDYDILLELGKYTNDSNAGGTSAAHVMVEPVEVGITVERSQDITNGMFGLRADDIYRLHCKEADIAEAGLSDPFCHVTMSCDDGNDYILLLSEQFADEDGDKYCYGMLEGGKVIYTIKAEDARWVSVMPVDMASRMMVTSMVWNITEYSISCSNGDSVSFEITPLRDDITVTNASAEDYTVKKNGEECEFERFRALYGFLINGNGEDLAFGEPVPDNEPLMTLKYTDSYIKETVTMEFYEKSAMTALVVINGESKYTCSLSYVNTFIENVKRAETGEEYLTTWK